MKDLNNYTQYFEKCDRVEFNFGSNKQEVQFSFTDGSTLSYEGSGDEIETSTIRGNLGNSAVEIADLIYLQDEIKNMAEAIIIAQSIVERLYDLNV